MVCILQIGSGLRQFVTGSGFLAGPRDLSARMSGLMVLLVAVNSMPMEITRQIVNLALSVTDAMMISLTFMLTSWMSAEA